MSDPTNGTGKFKNIFLLAQLPNIPTFFIFSSKILKNIVGAYTPLSHPITETIAVYASSRAYKMGENFAKSTISKISKKQNFKNKCRKKTTSLPTSYAGAGWFSYSGLGILIFLHPATPPHSVMCIY